MGWTSNCLSLEITFARCQRPHSSLGYRTLFDHDPGFAQMREVLGIEALAAERRVEAMEMIRTRFPGAAGLSF